MLAAEFATPVPFVDFENGPGTRTLEEIRIQPCLDQRPLTGRHLMQERDAGSDGVTVATSFYWPPSPTGAVSGYTAPLDRWVESTIAGLTTTPIALRGYFSQTYRPEHHNFSEN